MKQSHYNELLKIAADLETEGDGAIAKSLRSVLTPSDAEGASVAKITGADEYGPMIEWSKHWTELIGSFLYAAPVDPVAIVSIELEPSFESPLTPYGLLVRALRVVANTTLYDMSQHMRCSPAMLSGVEFGRKPLTDEMVAATAAFFSIKGIHGTRSVLNAATTTPDVASDAVALSAFDTLKAALLADDGYAWSWHCNLAMPIMDSIRCTPEQANKAGADLMQYLFGIDVRKFKEWHHDQPEAPKPIYQIGSPVSGGIMWWDVDHERYEREKNAGYMKTGIVYRVGE